jgi:predicted metal-dependent peptidase
MSALQRIQQETEQWFLTEPLFFTVYCTHKLTMNPNMQCALRTGKGRIEYNPTLVDQTSDSVLKDMLKVEIVRILLGHPYARQPLGCNPVAMHMASDMVIKPAYHLAWTNMASPSDFGLPEGQHYEWYAMRLNDRSLTPVPSPNGEGSEEQDETSSPPNPLSKGRGGTPSVEEEQEGDRREKEEQKGQGDGVSTPLPHREGQGEGSGNKGEADYTALWEEDAFQARQITDLIQSTTQWGSLPAGMIELIKKSTEGRIDYRNALRGFRASILSQKRRLTRMRPSRRFGFEQMGSRYDFITRILVAVDTSGSVGSEELGRYFNVITTFFKYGIQQVDVLMFDASVQGDVMRLDDAKKRKQEFKVQGRGGTNFQAPVDYLVEHPEYDGMIIITDGYAPVPDIPPLCKAKLLWIIDNEASYRRNGKALRKTGRVCLMQV